MSWLHLYAAVQFLVTQVSHSGPRVPAGARSSLRPLSIEGEAMKQSSGDMRREDDQSCVSLNKVSCRGHNAASLRRCAAEPGPCINEGRGFLESRLCAAA
jgi:hypothetical protein